MMTDWEFEESKKELEGFKERLRYIRKIYDFYQNQEDKEYNGKRYADVVKEYSHEERELKHKIELFELGHKYEEELRERCKQTKQILREYSDIVNNQKEVLDIFKNNFERRNELGCRVTKMKTKYKEEGIEELNKKVSKKHMCFSLNNSFDYWD
jgi:hypothetical protein